MICPWCDGRGGHEDYFGEWTECPLCDEEGQTTLGLTAAFYKSIADMDAEIDRLYAGC